MRTRELSRTGFAGFVSLCMLMIAFLCAPTDCWAGKKIVIEFEPGWAPPGINSAAVQSQISQRVRSHFGFATNVTVATDGSTDFDKKVIIKADAHAGTVVGHHFVCQSTNYVYGGTFKTAFNNSPALLNDTAVARAVSRTAAHEPGHHGGLDDDGADPSNTMGRPGLGPRVVTDSRFTTAAQTELMSWINGTTNKADAGLANDDFGDALVCVFGEYMTTGEIIDDANQFNVVTDISGPGAADFELGWMTIYDSYVPKMPAGTSPDLVSMFCGYNINLAVRDTTTGQVFKASEYADPPLFANPIPAAVSSCPVVNSDYFATVTVNFPTLGVTVMMDAMPENPTCGFLAFRDAYPNKVPSVREWGVVILAVLLMGYVVWRVSRRFGRAEAK